MSNFLDRTLFIDLRSLSTEVMDKGIYKGMTRAEIFLKQTKQITATLSEIPDMQIKENRKAFNDQG